MGLDFIRCTYEPNPVGTWLLNGNPNFLSHVLTGAASSIAYSSSSLSYDDNFGEHYQKVVAPSLKDQGFDINQDRTVFVIITTSQDYLTPLLVGSVTDALTGNFTSDEDGNRNIMHFGYCRDDALVDSIRVSVLVVS